MIKEITKIKVDIKQLWNYIFASRQFQAYFSDVENESKATLELDDTKLPHIMGLDVNIHIATEYVKEERICTLNMFNVQIWNHENNMIEIENYKELFDYAENQIKMF